MLPQLPPGFRLGTGTAAHQVEGAACVDGKGPSTWDTFAATPGHVADGTTGKAAADHYHRVEEDVALLGRLGAPGYRFSISWPRVVPTGSGAVNRAGLDFYDRLVDRLLEAGVRPMATLHHWDLPQGLQDDGGWLNPATVERFAEYATVVGETLADRVEDWVPIDSPNLQTMLGHALGLHAPGMRLVLDAVWVAHHLLLGHGRAAIALRGAGATNLGCANNHSPVWPASDGDADVGAAKLVDALWNGMYLEAMLLGRYPVDLMPLLEDIVAPGDLATIRQPLDFYGVNYFSPMKVAATTEDAELPFEALELLGHPSTDGGWAVVPDALREWLIMFRARYRAALPPIVVTASGCAYDDEPGADGVVDDQRRIDYHDAHLRAIATAVERGVDVRGYYAWSLLDGFEWADGLRRRFGLVHVDHVTHARTPKRSFDWFRELAASVPLA